MTRHLGTLLLFLVAGCERSGVLLWRAQSHGATVYLLGSVATPEGEPGTFDPRIQAAFEASDELMLESRVDVGAAREAQGPLLNAMRLPDGDTLHARIQPELEQRLAKVLERAGGSIDAAQLFRPWAIAVVLVNDEKKKLGYPLARPIDRHFVEEAKKPTAYLLSPEEAISTLAGLSPAADADCLGDVLDSLGGYSSDWRKAYRAWRHGDESAFVEQELKILSTHPSCSRELREARMKIFMPKLARMFDEPKTTFLVIGATSLVCEGGILAALREKGIEVRKL